MTFLSNVSRGLNQGMGNVQQPRAAANLFGGNVAAPNPFAGKTTPQPPTGVPGGVPKAPSFAKPNAPKAPSFAKPAGVPSKAPVPPTMIKPKEVIAEEKAKEVVAEEVLEQETTIEVKEEVKEKPKMPSFVKKVAENKEDVMVKEESNKEEGKPIQETLLAEEPKKEEAKPAKKTRSRKKTTAKKEEAPVDEPMTDAEVEMISKVFKMPSTKITYAEAVKATSGTFIDEEWEAAKQEILTESDAIVIENGMTGASINAVSVQLNKLREKVWVSFVETKVILENLSRKDTEGLIERVKYMNMEGTSSEMRKKSAVVAVMSYKTPNNDIVNLYEVYDETKARFEFLKGVMETIAFKSSSLITMNSALKMDK